MSLRVPSRIHQKLPWQSQPHRPVPQTHPLPHPRPWPFSRSVHLQASLRPSSYPCIPGISSNQFDLRRQTHGSSMGVWLSAFCRCSTATKNPPVSCKCGYTLILRSRIIRSLALEHEILSYAHHLVRYNPCTTSSDGGQCVSHIFVRPLPSSSRLARYSWYVAKCFTASGASDGTGLHEFRPGRRMSNGKREDTSTSSNSFGAR